MPNQNQTPDEQLNRKHQPTSQPALTTQPDVGRVATAELPEIPLTADPEANIQAQAASLSHPHISLLQRQEMADKISNTYGNIHMLRVMRAIKETQGSPIHQNRPAAFGSLQTKLMVNEPGDMYEQEADQVAEAVMRMPDSAPPPPPGDDEEKPFSTLQRSISRVPAANDAGPTPASSEVESRIHGMQGGGSPLPETERSFFENRMGADLNDVRVHTDDTAAQTSEDLNARAFTVGSDIAFNTGEYQPGSAEGRHLLAHELTHVVQQGGAGQLQRQPQQTIQREEGDQTGGEATPTPEEQAAAAAAAEAAEAIAAEARATGQDQEATTTTAGVSKQAEGEQPRQEAATSQAQGPVQEEIEKARITAAVAAAAAAIQTGLETRATAVNEVQTAQAAMPNTLVSGAVTPTAGDGAQAGGGGGTAEAATTTARATVQQAFTAAASAADKAPISPEADPAYQGVQTVVKTVGQEQQTHDSAQGEADESQAAAESPQKELEGKAQSLQVSEMEQVETPLFDAAAFKARLMERIAALTPSSMEEADNFKGNNQLSQVKDEMTGQVEQERATSQAPLAEKTAASPDTSRVEPKPVTPLTPADPGAAPTVASANQAAPKAKGAGEVETPLQESDQALDTQMTQANITEEQLSNSNEPEFTAALAAKEEAQTSTQTAAPAYRQFEQTQIDQAEAAAVAAAQTQTQAMFNERTNQLGQVDAHQLQTKSEDEKAREKVGDDIDAIYQETKTKVDEILNRLDGEVNTAFDEGAVAAKKTFEDFVDAKMEAYKEKRYGGWLGWAKWAKDKLFGMPADVNTFYEEGRQLYLNEMDAVIDKVMAIINTGLAQAAAEISHGKLRIQEYVDQLPIHLKEAGQQAAQDIQSKFDQLEQNISNKQNELIDTLANKYQENLQAIDARIEEMKAANQGLVDKAIEAMGGVITTILKLKDMLLGILSSAADAIMLILQDPIGFIGNLINGVKQGLLNFVDNIGTHLQTGFVEWLTGTMGEAGIQMPEDIFSLQGILDLVLQVLGLTWENFRSRAVGIFGDRVVSALETGLELFIILKDEGLPGVWEWIQDKLASLKDQVIEGIKEMLISEVIEAGIQWLIGLLGGPAGAFIKACKMIYDIVVWFINNAERIMSLVQAVIDSVTAIAQGDISVAAKYVEESLARFVPVAIGFLAGLLGLGDLSKKVRKIIDKIQEPVNEAIDYILNLIKSFVMKIAKLLGFGGQGGEGGDGEVGKEVTFSDGEESHRLWVEVQGAQATLMIASDPMSVENKLADFETRLTDLPEDKQTEVRGLIQQARSLLTNADQLADGLAKDMDRVKKIEEADTIQQKDASLEQEQDELSPVLKDILTIFREAGQDKFEDWIGVKVVTRNDTGDDTINDESFKPTGYGYARVPRLKRTGVKADHVILKREAGNAADPERFPKGCIDKQGAIQLGDEPEVATDEEKIEEYQKVLRAANIPPTTWPEIQEADPYREEMRRMVVEKYAGDIEGLHKDIIATKPCAYPRVIGEIFEEWCEANMGGVIRRPVPTFNIVSNDGDLETRMADGVIEGTDTLVEMKAVSVTRGPNSDEKAQMSAYNRVITERIPWIRGTEPSDEITFSRVRYVFSHQGVANEWKSDLDELIPGGYETDPPYDPNYEAEIDQAVEDAAPKAGDEDEDTNVQRKTLDSYEASEINDESLAIHIQKMNNGGQPLPTEEQAFFENQMGVDFSQVRIHADDEAAQTAQSLSARAFTVGHNIAFNAGEYQPGDESGRRLLAHELTHVVQQGAATPAKQGGNADVQSITGGGGLPAVQRMTDLDALGTSEALKRYQIETAEGQTLKTVKEIIDHKYGPNSRDENYNPQLKVEFEQKLAELVLNDLGLVSDAVKSISNTVLLYLYERLEQGSEAIRTPIERLGSAKTNLQEKLAELQGKLAEAETRIMTKAQETGMTAQLDEFSQTMDGMMQITKGQLGYMEGLILGTDLDPTKSEECFDEFKKLLSDAPSSPNELAMHLNMHLRFYTEVFRKDFNEILKKIHEGAQLIETKEQDAQTKADEIAQQVQEISKLAANYETDLERLADKEYTPISTLQAGREMIDPRAINGMSIGELEALLTDEDWEELNASGYETMDEVKRRDLLRRYIGRPRTDSPYNRNRQPVNQISGNGRMPLDEEGQPAPSQLPPLNIDQTGVLAHVRGGDLFYLDEINEWSQRARIELDMPLLAGPSGSTSAMMAAAVEMGLGDGEEKMKYAMALVGSLVGGGHHSFHEIMTVAQLAGVPYQEGSYMSIIQALPGSLRTQAEALIKSDKYKVLLQGGSNE